MRGEVTQQAQHANSQFLHSKHAALASVGAPELASDIFRL